MPSAMIVSSARTPIGSFLGSLSHFSAIELGALAIDAVIKKSQSSKNEIDQVIMGHVLQGGCGQAPARQALLKAGLLSSVSATTVNKVCGSGLKAVMMAADAILLQQAQVVVAGGMESMSNAPYLLPNARAGFRMGNQTLLDLMLYDGLLDPYSGAHMGSFADACASKYNFTREEQDNFAKQSYLKAQNAKADFADEIIPVKVMNKVGELEIINDEEPTRFNPEKMLKLKPAFSPDGTVTVANASKINDGAAALLVMSEEKAVDFNNNNKTRIVAYDCYAHDPAWFTTAPIMAITSVLKKAGLTIEDIDLFEINEAFSVVTMAAITDLKLDPSKVNVFGGAVALGHPIGCSGARLVVTLINALEKRSKHLGLIAICLGGGEALAMIIERVS
jgi:acetyl-CoA C-acetyltransferase